MNKETEHLYTTSYNTLKILTYHEEIIELPTLFQYDTIKLSLNKDFISNVKLFFYNSISNTLKHTIDINFNQLFNLEVDGHSNSLSFSIKVEHKDNPYACYSIITIVVPNYEFEEGTELMIARIAQFTPFAPVFVTKPYLDKNKGIVVDEHHEASLDRFPFEDF